MMGICWKCYWGWPEEICQIFEEACRKIGDESLMEYGPAHIVWSDENFDSAQWCLDNFEKYRREEYSEEEHEVVRESLRKLLLLPDHIIDFVPKEYDDEHPENFPPPPTLKIRHSVAFP